MAPPPSAAASLLLVCGLKREAAIAAGPDTLAICGHAPTLQAKLARLAGQPLSLVVGFGICGGLDPKLRPGDIVVGTQVTSEATLLQVGTGERVLPFRGRAAAACNETAEPGVAAPVDDERDKTQPAFEAELRSDEQSSALTSCPPLSAFEPRRSF